MRAEYYMYLSTIFSFWGDRMWTFAIGLYLVEITPGSLQLAAIFGLVLSFTAIVFSPMVGDWIDRTPRLTVIRILLLLQNMLVILCAIIVLIYLYSLSTDSSILEILKILIIITGSAANLASQGETIAVGKDWVVVVSRGSKDRLTKTNAFIRAIDQTVAILAPLAVGLLMSLVDQVGGIIFICCWNVMSMFAEYFLLLKVYHLVPELRLKVRQGEETFSLLMEDETSQGNHRSLTENSKTTVSEFHSEIKKSYWDILARFKTVIVSWKIYYKQNVFLAGCALSMLFLTVIAFGATTIGYAYMQGLTEFNISICMGLGSLCGVLGTFLYPKIRACIGLPKSGLVGLFIEWSTLLLCAASVWLPGSPSNMYVGETSVIPCNKNTNGTNSTFPCTEEVELPMNNMTSIIVLMAGIVLSRAGLWITDLTITQLQQENVPERERGVVGGVQYSLNCILDLVQYGLTIIFPKSDQFGILVLISVSAVACSATIYSIFLVRFLDAKGKENKKKVDKENAKVYYGSTTT